MKFKVGDRVLVYKSVDQDATYIGKTGIVVTISNSHFYPVNVKLSEIHNVYVLVFNPEELIKMEDMTLLERAIYEV